MCTEGETRRVLAEDSGSHRGDPFIRRFQTQDGGLATGPFPILARPLLRSFFRKGCARFGHGWRERLLERFDGLMGRERYW